jgi:hypothetical protein
MLYHRVLYTRRLSFTVPFCFKKEKVCQYVYITKQTRVNSPAHTQDRAQRDPAIWISLLCLPDISCPPHPEGQTFVLHHSSLVWPPRANLDLSRYAVETQCSSRRPRLEEFSKVSDFWGNHDNDDFMETVLKFLPWTMWPSPKTLFQSLSAFSHDCFNMQNPTVQ